MRRMIVSFFAVAAFIVASAFPLAAQVFVADEIVTSEVSLFDTRDEPQRSINVAMGLSLLLPGMGHYYIDKSVSAWTYLSVDFVSIFSAIAFYGVASQRENEARSYAIAAAGIEKPASGAAYWRHVGAFMDAAEYNEVIELSRGTVDDQFLDPATWWRWGDESQKDTYNGLRQKARNMRVASSFFVGAIVANRLVSAIDLRVFHRKGLSSGIRVESSFAPDMSGAALSLKTDF